MGHRDPLTGEPIGDRDEWTTWDYSLIYAMQTIEDYSDEYGLLAWELADDAVFVNANKRIHKFREAMELATKGTEKKPYKASPGEYFVPEVYSRRKDEDGNEVFPTFTEWMMGQTEGN